MSDQDLEARLDAVERALTDGETDLGRLEEAADLAADVDRIEERVTDLESTVADLEAAVQAVRGYAGNVRAVNRDVERRASAALAKAETLETALDADGATAVPGSSDWTGGTDAARDAPYGDGNTPTAGADGHAGVTDAAGSASAPHADGRGNPSAGTDDHRDGAPGRDGRAGRGGGSDGQVRESAPDAGPGAPDDGGRAAGSGANAVSRAERPTAGDHVTGNTLGSAGRRTNESDGDDQSRRTSQFIERVRDAL